MREFKDKTGFEVRVESITGHNAFDGLLEGSPYMVRRRWLRRYEEFNKRRGQWAFGVEALERELVGMTHDFSDWPPCEEWHAKLVRRDYPGPNRRYLNLLWHQEGIDPMQHLAGIVAELDFRQLCAEEPYNYFDD